MIFIFIFISVDMPCPRYYGGFFVDFVILFCYHYVVLSSDITSIPKHIIPATFFKVAFFVDFFSILL